MTTPPVPTQRKVKLHNALKSIHSEQISKLQAKVQLEHDLLEDIKTYTKLRATAEKEYAQNLQKMATQMLSKFQSKDKIKDAELSTPYGLWRRILEETETAATARLTVSQKLISDISDNIKVLKQERATIVKQCSSLSEKLQEEVLHSAAELTKCQKNYTDLQKVTEQANEQVNDLEEKLKKGSTRIFTSKSRLEKNLSRATERRNNAEKHSTISRNDYIIALAAMNAHQQKYYGSDIPDLLATQDGDLYNHLKKYYVTIVNTELEALNNCVENLNIVDNQVKQLERAFAIQLFLKENPVFTKCDPIEFAPAASDKVSVISKEHGAELNLNKEARKWTTRLSKEQRNIRKKTRELKKLQTSANSDTKGAESTGGGEQSKIPEPTVESLTEELRHLEVLRTKSEARVEALRQAGVNVNEWIQNSNEDNENESDSGDEIGDDSCIDDEFMDGGDDEWDDPSSPIPNSQSDDALSSTSSQDHRTLAVAIYAFQATSQEELSIYDGEELEVIDSEGDGWCRAKNKNGQIGYVPESYVEIKSKSSILPTIEADRISRSSTLSGSIPQSDFRQDIPSVLEPDFICYAKAAYDYDACEEEELTFTEGDVILVTSKNVDDDDGWWEGIYNGKRGVFPSIVVEEMKTNDDSDIQPENRPRVATAVDQCATFPRSRDDMRRVRSMDLNDNGS